MSDPLQHEAFIALETALGEAREQALGACSSLSAQLKKVHEAVGELSRLVSQEEENGPVRWTSAMERFETFRAALSDGLGMGDSEKARIAELEAALSEKDSALTETQERLRSLEQEQGEQVAASAAARERAGELERRTEELEEDLAAHVSKAELWAQTEQEYADRNASLQEQVARLEEEGRRLATAEAESATAREEVTRLQEALDKAPSQEEVERLKVELTETRNRVSELQQTLETQEHAYEGGSAAAPPKAAETVAPSAEQEKEPAPEPKEEEIPDPIPIDLGLEEALPALGDPVSESEQGVPEGDPAPIESTEEPAPKRGRRGGARKNRLGTLLIEAGVITEEQLEDVVAEQAKNPSQHIGELLVLRGYASESAVAQALASQCDVEFVNLKTEEIETEAVALISDRLAQQHTCIPVRASADMLVLAMANPMNLLAIEDVERASGRKVEVVVATPSGVREAVESLYWEPE